MSAQLNKLKFQDKVAIVTGGVQGIGRAIVDILAENGGKVVIFDIQDEVGSKISYDGPGEIIYMHCDMTKDDEIQASIDETVRRLGKLDCLVNNVGTHPGFISIDDTSVQAFRDILSVNLVSYFAASKFALPYLRKTKGCIVNVGSNLAVHACRNSVTYIASKGGVSSMTKALAIDEAKYGVRVNTICPGVTVTKLLNEVTTEEIRQTMAKCFPLGRLAQPEEMARACLYLVVDATFSTGTDLICTGGSDIGYGIKEFGAAF
ncbi:hypothetical protein ACF0H5_006421 [Mactra antiquata]